MTFFYLLNIPNHFIVYTHALTTNELESHIQNYLLNGKNKIELFYSCEQGRLENNYELINLTYSSINFEETLKAHNYSKNKINNQSKLLKGYEKISVPFEEIKETLKRDFNKSLKNNSIEQGILASKALFLRKKEFYSNYKASLMHFIKIVTSLFPILQTFDFEEYLTHYRIINHHKLFCRSVYKTVTFNDVYYRNKGFYNKDGSFFNISQIQQDIEYKDYNKNKLTIFPDKSIEIQEHVLFLDYIYDFYNFGEFWDVVKRLIFLQKDDIKNFYGLQKHRILNINSYFEKAGIQFPPKYLRDYGSVDETQETNNGSTVFFKQVTFSVLENTSRSSLDPWTLHMINKKYNTCKKSTEKYVLYLSRGNMPRGFAQETELISLINDINNLKIINGSESFEEQQFLFTNAKAIIGVHGALQGNFIWNKNSALFIELTPLQRCVQLCHFNDAVDCGFDSIIIPCLSNEKEIINLNSEQIKELGFIIKVLVEDLDET